MNGFLHWLLTASLQACLVLPWLGLLVAFSRRAPAVWLALLLAVGMVLPLAAPLLQRWLPGPVAVIPVLERTGFFDSGLLPAAPGAGGEPLPPPGDHAVREWERRKWLVRALGIWGAGAAAMLLGTIWQMLRERLYIGRGVPLSTDDPLLGEWRSAVASAGLRRVPWMVRHEGGETAVIAGVTAPVLSVGAALGELGPAHRAMILRHEAEHAKRRDVARRLLLEIPRIVFWFHPLYHLALRRYDLEVEKACDDAVLRDGHAPGDYAELLLAEARRRRGGKAIRRRIRALLGRERSRVSVPRLGWGYALLFGLLILPAVAVKIRPWREDGDFQALAVRPDVAAWWRCHTGHGSVVADWSGRNLHGRIFGARWVKDSERSVCLEFNGAGDTLALPAVDCDWSGGPLTIAMWLKPREDSDGGGLLLRGEPNRAWSGAKEHRFVTGYADYGEREIVLAGDIREMHGGSLNPGLRPGINLFGIIAMSVPVSLTTGCWTHVALTLAPEGDDIVFRCYLDASPVGEERFSGELRKNLDWQTSWWWFGRGESPPVQGNDYEGRLADLAVLRRALDESELRELMAGRIPE